MKYRRITILIFVFAIACLFITTACEKTSVKPVSVAIVLGNHNNARGLNYQDKDLKLMISEVISNYGQIYIIASDGKPDIAVAYDYDILDQYKSASESKLKADATQKATMLFSEIATVKADDPELDVLEALRISVKSLAGAPPGEKKIIVLDSMLSTTGIVNFNNNLLNADPETIADQLAAKQAIPDFSSIHVILYLGETAEPQKKLSPAQQIRLIAIWEAIIEKGGGTFDCKEALSVNDDNNENLPKVSTINVEEEEPISFDPLAINILDENKIKFEGNTPEYDSPESSIEENLKPAIDYLKSHPDYSILVIGSTASGDESFCEWLSNARAETVKKTLVGMGVSPNQIITRGLSFHDKWHLPDINENGLLIEEEAKQNRKVVILDATCAEAKEILQSAF